MTDVYDEVMMDIPDWAYGLFPEAPIAFQREPDRLFGPWCYREIGLRRMAALYVICTARLERDGRRWMHVSCSRRTGLPTWRDLTLVKHTFVGDERVAVQVFPVASEYVNYDANTLHLWSCLDGAVVPDFRAQGVI